MLLVALDLMDEGVATATWIPLALAAARFDDLLERAELLGPQRGPGRAFQPIFHLSTSRATSRRVPFWRLLKDGRQRDDIEAPSSTAALLRHADAVELLEPLRSDAESPEGRQRIRWAIYDLLDHDGAADSNALVVADDRDRPRVQHELERLEQRLHEPFQLDDPSAEIVVSLVERVARDRAFRKSVLVTYQHSCALCGLRIRWGARVEAQAAHIKPRALFGADDMRNALSLCRTHHWAFDEGLWTAGDDLTVRVRAAPIGEVYEMSALATFSGRTLHTPASGVRPHPAALAWHRAGPFDEARWGRTAPA
jgi:hypothetical protein